MQERKEDGPLDGYLEFPGGKIESGESFEQAAEREFLEETGASSAKVKAFKNYSHEYVDRSVKLFVFIGQMPGKSELSESGWKNIDLNNPLSGLEDKVLEANKNLIIDLSKYFQEILEDESWRELWPQL